MPQCRVPGQAGRLLGRGRGGGLVQCGRGQLVLSDAPAPVREKPARGGQPRPGRTDPGQAVPVVRPGRDPGGRPRRADQQHPSRRLAGQVAAQHGVLERVPGLLRPRMGVHVDQSGQQPAAIGEPVCAGHRLFAEHAAVNEQRAFFPVRQDDSGDSEHHKRCLSGSTARPEAAPARTARLPHSSSRQPPAPPGNCVAATAMPSRLHGGRIHAVAARGQRLSGGHTRAGPPARQLRGGHSHAVQTAWRPHPRGGSPSNSVAATLMQSWWAGPGRAEVGGAGWVSVGREGPGQGLVQGRGWCQAGEGGGAGQGKRHFGYRSRYAKCVGQGGLAVEGEAG